MLIFYSGNTVDDETGLHNGTLNVGTLRLDGFAGMGVDKLAARRHGKPGMLMTHLMAVESSELELNIVGHNGTAKVALFDEGVQVIPGYELENCLPIPEDTVRAAIQWKDKTDISELQGKRVSVLVQMATGTIYSFRM